MEIQEKLIKFKYPIILSLSLSLIITCIILIAPRFLTILAYFWPLFLSTALFLLAVLVFARTSPLPHTEVSAQKHGEGILDYVAGQHEQDVHSYNNNNNKLSSEEQSCASTSNHKSDHDE